MKETETLPEQDFIRTRLYETGGSAFTRYCELTIGEVSVRRLLTYEFVILFFSQIPGSLGLVLRKFLYPLLLADVGKGVVFGRNVVVRNGHGISIGRGTVIDDDCLLDARGAGEGGLKIGEQVILNRGAAVQAKHGPIEIGDRSDIGAGSIITSQGSTSIGSMVSIGAGCKIGGGGVALGDAADPAAPTNAFDQRGHRRISKGAVLIEAGCLLGRGVVVQDGVTVGRGSVIGSGAVLRESVPGGSVVIPQHRNLIVPRDQFAQEQKSVDRAAETPSQSQAPEAVPDDERSSLIRESVYAAIEQLNEQLPPESRLKKQGSSALIAPNGPLDSLGVINLAVTIENELERNLSRSVDLLSAVGEGDAYSSVAQLVDHIHKTLKVSRAEL